MTKSLKFRTVTGKVYEMDVQNDWTVLQLKQKLQETHNDICADSCKMILSAKMLADTTRVEDINPPPNAYIVLHTSAQKKPAQKIDTPSAPAALDDAPPPLPDTRPQPSAVPFTLPSTDEPLIPPNGGSAGPPSLAPESRSSGPRSGGDPPDFDRLVESLVEIGFPRDQCEQALRLAHYDTDQAANLLLSGPLPAAGWQPPPAHAGFGGEPDYPDVGHYSPAAQNPRGGGGDGGGKYG
jgi:UV excision repair protein RAD23